MLLLHTAGAEAGSLTHAVPFGCWLRRFPTQWTHRRRSKGDAEEVASLAVCAILPWTLPASVLATRGLPPFAGNPSTSAVKLNAAYLKRDLRPMKSSGPNLPEGEEKIGTAATLKTGSQPCFCI